MRYDLANLPFKDLLEPVSAASAMLARLDERVDRSAEGAGWLDRSHFFDACASLWVDGELVHVEDLVLHDAGMGVRKPTHELTIAQDILRTRRRIMANAPDWALSHEGLRALRRGDDVDETHLETKSFLPPLDRLDDEAGDDPLASELAAIDLVLARSEALLASVREPAISSVSLDRDALVYEPDWDEDERFAEWLQVLNRVEGLPQVLRAAVLLDAWNALQVLQHAPWLGRLLAASTLRQSGLATNYLLPINVGLKQVPRQKRMHRHRDARLLALTEAIHGAAELGLKEHDRLLLARRQMEHRLVGRRSSSKLPQLIELLLAVPIVSTTMIAETLSITPQGALKLAGELNLRELTGRGRFRAWGIL